MSALVSGENGSGKSTLVDILLGLLKPVEGKILINENEREDLNFIFNKTGYLPQDHLIISGKIINNITLESDSTKINQNKLSRALNATNLQNMISELPNGLDTIIGKDGVRLSGGQYKKIALARLFYHDKDILILDEATSSLDLESEKIVMNELKNIKKNKTLIIISHDLKQLEICDMVYKISNKKIDLVSS